MTEPQWYTVAKHYLGTKEYPGAPNNPVIMGWLKALNWSWLGGDAAPWCGSFVSFCMKQCGIVPPKTGFRALSWSTWGVSCAPQVGAVGVKSRKGGGHVFLIVGETPDKRYYKALGGNQGDTVSIIDILKADVTAVRWPAGVPENAIPLPKVAAGKTGVSEA